MKNRRVIPWLIKMEVGVHDVALLYKQNLPDLAWHKVCAELNKRDMEKSITIFWDLTTFRFSKLLTEK